MNRHTSLASSEPRQRELDILAVAKQMLLDAPIESTPFSTIDGQNWLEATVRLGRRIEAYESALKRAGILIPVIDERPEKLIRDEQDAKAREFWL